MNPNRCSALGLLGGVCAAMILLPSFAAAQAGGARAGGGMGGMAAMQQMRQVLAQLDLTPDQKSKIQGIMKQTMQDVRDAAQGLADATPEERQGKMQDMQKLVTEAKDKIEAEFTPEQKAKYYPLMAKAALKQMTDLLTAVKSAESSEKIADDLSKQLNDVLDDTQKTLEGYKSDADAVTDEASAKDFQQKLTKVQMDLRKQVVDILGQDDAMKLMQSARQSMRPGAAARKESGATTEPVAK